MFIFTYLFLFDALFSSFQLQNAGCFTCGGMCPAVKLLCSECTWSLSGLQCHFTRRHVMSQVLQLLTCWSGPDLFDISLHALSGTAHLTCFYCLIGPVFVCNKWHWGKKLGFCSMATAWAQSSFISDCSSEYDGHDVIWQHQFCAV